MKADHQSMRTYHIIVRGKVQGVGFRNFTQKWAQLCGVLGWVRNLKSGDVEILVQGASKQLEQFLLQIKNGPPRSTVSECILKDILTAKIFVSFERKQDGEFPDDF